MTDSTVFYRHYRAGLPPDLDIQGWSKAYGWYLRGWLPKDRDASILDLGCGEGRLLAALKRWGYRRLTGLDLRPEAVSCCRAQGLKVEQGDARGYLRGLSRRYHLILAMDLLEHLAKEEGLSLLQDVRQALLPGGMVIIQVPNFDSPWGGAVFFGDLTHRTGFTCHRTTELLRLAGFSRVEVRPAGPGLWSAKSCCRYLLWQPAAALIRLYNLIECGDPGPRVITRVLLARGLAIPDSAPAGPGDEREKWRGDDAA